MTQINPELLLRQAEVSAPLPGDIVHGTDLVVAPRRTVDRLRHFPEEIYSLLPESHLVRLLNVLLGNSGAGQLRKYYLLQRFRQSLQGAHFLDLDRFYGALFGFSRLSYETLTLMGGDIGTSADWKESAYRDASYRSRIEQFARAIPYGPSPTGMELVAESVLSVDCNVYERYLSIDQSFTTYGAIEAKLGTYGAMEFYTYGALEGFNVGGSQMVPDRQEFTVVPTRDITEEERYVLIRVLEKLKPASAFLNVETHGLEIHEEILPRGVVADSEFWEIVPKVVATNPLLYTVPSPSGTPVEQPRPPFSGYEGESWDYNGDLLNVRAYSERQAQYGQNIVPNTGPPLPGKRNIDPFLRGDGRYLIPEEVAGLFSYIAPELIGTPQEPKLDLFGNQWLPPGFPQPWTQVSLTMFWMTIWQNVILPQVQQTVVEFNDDHLRVVLNNGTIVDFSPSKGIMAPRDALAGRSVADGVMTSPSLWDVNAVSTNVATFASGGSRDDFFHESGALYTDRILVNFNVLQSWQSLAQLTATDPSARFWATPERVQQDNTREILEMQFNGNVLVNNISLETARFPHTILVQVYDALGSQWVTVHSQTITDSTPSQFNSLVAEATYAQHPDTSSHWVPITVHFPARTTGKARVVLVRNPNGRPPTDAQRRALHYSLAVRNFRSGMQIAARTDAPRVPGPVAVTRNILGDSVVFELDVDSAQNLLLHNNQSWRSEPMPVNNAVVSLYVDVRDDDGNGQIIDRFFLDPLYPGPMLHLYYATDIPAGLDAESSDTLLPFGVVTSVGTVIPTSDGILLDSIALSHIDIKRSETQFDYSQPWWVGVEVRPSFAQGSGNHVIVDLDGHRIEFQTGIVRFTSVAGDTTTVAASFNANALVRVVVAYNPTATAEYAAGWTLAFETQYGTLTTANVAASVPPVTPATQTRDAIRIGDSQAGSGAPAAFTLRSFVLKQEVLKGAEISAFFSDPQGYVTKGQFAAEIDTGTLNAVLRYAPSMQTSDFPYGITGGPLDIYSQLVWHPLQRDYTVQKGYVHMPSVMAKIWKLEFTSLVAEHFESYVPLSKTVKTFPGTVSAAVANAQALGAAILDPGVSTLMASATALMYLDSGALRFSGTQYAPNDYLPTDALHSTDLERSQAIKVTGSDYSYATWHQESASPQFTDVGTHDYSITIIDHRDKVGFFAGLKELRAFRIRYDRIDDTLVYKERFEDQVHIRPNSSFRFGHGYVDSGPADTGPGGLVLDGASNSVASTPDSPDWNFSGVISGTMHVKLPDYTPPGSMFLVDHYDNTANARAWALTLNPDSTLQWTMSNNGVTVPVLQVSAPPGFVDGKAYWIGWEYNTGNGRLTFYKAPSSPVEPLRWSEWTVISTHSVAAIVPFDAANQVVIGGSGTIFSSRLTGTVYVMKLYDDGVVIANADFRPQGSPQAVAGAGSYTDSTGKVWTIRGTASIAAATPLLTFPKVVQSVAYLSQTPVTALQFATLESPGSVQLLADDSFGDSAKATYDWKNPNDWHKIGDATMTYFADQRQVRIDRSVGPVLVAKAHDPGLILPPMHPVLAEPDTVVTDPTATARLFGGIEMSNTSVSLRGQAWAAVRFTAITDLTSPYHLRILGTDGTVLAEKLITAKAGQTIEEYVGYTLGSYSSVPTDPGPWNPRTLVDRPVHPVANPAADSLVNAPVAPTDVDNALTVQLVQYGVSNDAISLDSLSLFEDAILWEFSNDGGQTFYQAIAIRNNPNGVIAFPMPGTQLVWRATAYRPNAAISSIQLRPWYGRSFMDSKRRQRYGPNLSSFDQSPPIDQDPEFKVWSKPIPYIWWRASQRFPLI